MKVSLHDYASLGHLSAYYIKQHNQHFADLFAERARGDADLEDTPNNKTSALRAFDRGYREEINKS